MAVPTPAWSESSAWKSADWHPLGGSFDRDGFSLEWHQLNADHQVQWADSIHPQSVEICLNLQGKGSIGNGKTLVHLSDGMVVFYARDKTRISASREAGQPHQFFTLEMSFDFIRSLFDRDTAGLHPLISRIVSGDNKVKGVGPSIKISARQEAVLRSLREPPVRSMARNLWFRSKAYEIISETLFTETGEELFCSRQQRVAQERVQKVMNVLREDIAEPPSLKEIGRRVGCSPYYLSRTFSRETGMTIPQYLRRLRMERAAEMLRTGHYNVTEVAFEVGYNSLSHFSQAFCQTMGNCPAIYQAQMKKDQAENNPDSD